MSHAELCWSKPIEVRLSDGSRRTFNSANDALDFLENEWPERPGSHYDQAVTLCRSAKVRLTSPEIARDAFIGACISAAIPIGPARAGHPHIGHMNPANR
jgi:hypothetical protein